MKNKITAQERDSDNQFTAIEQQLRAANQQLTSLSKFPEENDNPVLRIGVDGTLMYANPGALRQFADWNIQSGKPAPDALWTAVQATLTTNTEDRCQIDYRDRVYSFTVAHIKDEDYINLYGRDITSRKRSEEELLATNQQLTASNQQLSAIEQQLRASNQQLQASNQQLAAIEQQLRAANQQLTSLSKFPEENDNPVMRIADDGTLMYVNPAGIEQLADWSLESGKPAPDALWAAAKSLANDSNETYFEIDYRDRVYSFTVAHIKDEDYINLYGRDITSRKRSEEELLATNQQLEESMRLLKDAEESSIHQARLSALGQMASGIAHDFNNALMPIVGFTSLIIENPDDYLSDKKDLLTVMRYVQEAAEDARLIVRRLRLINPSYANNIHETVDLNAIVKSSVSLSKPRWKEQPSAAGCQIDLTMDLASAPCQVLGNSTELREALLNLIFNSVDAMPDGGKIRVYTQSEHGCAIVGVEDDGIGMASEVIAKCEEAFYTTKGPENSGLGLAMVHGISEEHNGTLDISSAPGKGTKVQILLPLQKTICKKPKKLETPITAEPMKICVVDDDPSSLRVTVLVLQKDGHDVTPLKSGADALELLKKPDIKWDLIISDRAMPVINGDRVIAEAKRLHPNTPTALLTGFGEMMAESGEMPPGVDKIISKPFTRDDFRTAINELLAKNS